jgi:FKBP-type peptidyl-prolyl cis-trans isomerase SlyD
MDITAPCLVEIDVRVLDTQGQLLETTSAPLAYLHGANDIFPALEASLEGHRTGDLVVVDLDPAQAFGDYEPQRVHLVARSLLGADCVVGNQVEGVPGEPSDGLIYRVTDLADDVAVIDGNHPYAGISLRFEMKVVSVNDVDPTQFEELGDDEARPPSFLQVAGEGRDR